MSKLERMWSRRPLLGMRAETLVRLIEAGQAEETIVAKEEKITKELTAEATITTETRMVKMVMSTEVATEAVEVEEEVAILRIGLKVSTEIKMVKLIKKIFKMETAMRDQELRGEEVNIEVAEVSGELIEENIEEEVAIGVEDNVVKEVNSEDVDKVLGVAAMNKKFTTNPKKNINQLTK